MRLIRSYRIQLILISMLTGSLALVAFAWISWNQVWRENQEQLDGKMREFLSRNGPRMFSLTLPEGASLRERNRSALGSELAQYRLAAAVVHQDSTRSWQSVNWPADLETSPFLSYALPPRHGHPPPEREGKGTVTPPAGSGRPRWPPPVENLVDIHRSTFETRQEFRLLVIPVADAALVVAGNISDFRYEMLPLLRSYLIAFPFALILIGSGAAFVANRALTPVRRLTKAVREIHANDLDQQLEVSTASEEFSQLIQVYNDMLERLRRSFAQAKRFSADAAHELNTPLTILLGHLDQAIQSAESGSQRQIQLTEWLDEVKRLNDIVQKLLLLSRADSGRLTLEIHAFDLSETLQQLCEDMEVLGSELSFGKHIQDSVRIEADSHWIRHILSNLLSNAVKYNRPGGKVDVELKAEAGVADIRISNTGTAIPESDVARIFDRFFRADPSRDSRRRGLGLGLSLAREFAQAHHGELRLEENLPDRIVFHLRLPLKQLPS